MNRRFIRSSALYLYIRFNPSLMKSISVFIFCTFFASVIFAQSKPKFRILAIAENGGHHIKYSTAAKVWLNKLAADSSFSIDYLQNANTITDSLLGNYQLFIQLDYPPYGWPEKAVTAFQEYIAKGKGGWIGFHHAGLLGEFDGFPMWQWFSKFMGGIQFKNYIATFAAASVNQEDKKHPVFKNVPASFPIVTEEWYTFDKSPRPNVHVLASVDEATYIPNSDIKMGDHPVIWTNPHYKAKNIYIFMGHSPDLFDNPSYTTLFKNAIFWAAKK
jgi:type 1 glutamine amidotransferase